MRIELDAVQTLSLSLLYISKAHIVRHEQPFYLQFFGRIFKILSFHFRVSRDRESIPCNGYTTLNRWHFITNQLDSVILHFFKNKTLKLKQENNPRNNRIRLVYDSTSTLHVTYTLHERLCREDRRSDLHGWSFSHHHIERESAPIFCTAIICCVR